MIPRRGRVVFPLDDRPRWYELTPFAGLRIVLVTFASVCVMVSCTLAPAAT